jgi:hypothetical protein
MGHWTKPSVLLKVNLFRVCLIAAVLSLSQAGHSITRPTSLMGEPHTLVRKVWVATLVPAVFLSYAVLPERYTSMHCYDEAPPNQDLVVRSTFVVAHVVFWTALAAATFLLVRFYRGGISTPRRRWIHAGLISVAAVVVPLLMLWIYFGVSGNANQRNMDFDIIAIAGSALIGCVVLSILPLTTWRRILIVAAYCPIAFYALIFCSRLIALKLFGDRL